MSYKKVDDGLVFVTGLPSSIRLKKTSSYGLLDLKDIPAAAHSLQFHGNFV